MANKPSNFGLVLSEWISLDGKDIHLEKILNLSLIWSWEIS